MSNADYYLQIGFTSGAGSLAANGQTGDLFVRITKADWSNFNENNDYSYNGSMTTYGDWPNVTVYRNGTLVWGTEPVSGSTPAPTFPVPTNTPGAATSTPLPPTLTSTPAPTTTGSALKVQYMAGNTTLSDFRLKPFFKVINLGSVSVPLSQLKIRYWFTRDTPQSVIFSCLYAYPGCGNVTGKYVYLSTLRPGADTYLEVGFTSGAGSLAANGGSSGVIQTYNRKADWSNFNQGDDYSFDAGMIDYGDWKWVTLYWNGALVWGQEP